MKLTSWGISVVGTISWASDDLSDWSNNLGDGGFLVDDGVKSVDGVGSIVNNATGSIGFDQGVLSGDNVSVAAF